MNFIINKVDIIRVIESGNAAIVAAIVTAVREAIGPSRMVTVPSSHQTPAIENANSTVFELPPDAPVWRWEAYIPSRTHLEKDYYLTKLKHKFYEVNGGNNYQIIKSRRFIRIKDGKDEVFRCGIDTSFQRNLYLQLHSVGYHCDVWIEEFVDFNCLEEAEGISQFQGTITPP